MKRRSSHRLFSKLRPATEERILNDAIEAFTKAKEDGRLDPPFALLGQTSAYLALGEEANAEDAFASALAASRAAEPSAGRRPGMALDSGAPDLERCFTEGLAKARRARTIKEFGQ